MYSTCLFCHSSLGANELIESFPIGRRLAFDAVKGRLWVVCRHCERWNLSPLEERWEAIEECERRFRATRLRASTENIGLARLREGLELVRIGAPLRPELAAWRYGDQFGRRRRRRAIKVGIGLGAGGGVIAGAVALGSTVGFALGGGTFWALRGIFKATEAVYRRIVYGSPSAVVARIGTGADRLDVRRSELDQVQLRAGASRDEWHLRIESARRVAEYAGDAGVRAAGLVLPAINWAGASPLEIRAATQLLEEARTPPELFARFARDHRSALYLSQLPTTPRLALEMAAHEESERRAMEGELAILEAAWRAAEEVAAISDNLLVPGAVIDRVAQLHDRESAPPPNP